jgi:hypothetical protein
MRYLALIVLAILSGCLRAPKATASLNYPVLGMKLSIPQNSEYMMTSLSESFPYTDVKIGEITYSMAANDSGKVVFISSSSPFFQTPEGVRVGSTLTEVLAAGGKPVTYVKNFTNYSELPSGWCAAFTVFIGFTGNVTEPLDPNTKVSHFFLRK